MLRDLVEIIFSVWEFDRNEQKQREVENELATLYPPLTWALSMKSIGIQQVVKKATPVGGVYFWIAGMYILDQKQPF